MREPILSLISLETHFLTRQLLEAQIMSSQIIELAAQISANTSNIHEYLASNALPFPSFDEDGPVDLKLSPKIAGARMAAINAATELQALLLGPADQLRPIV